LQVSERFKQSGLFLGTGDFDIYFCLAVIQRGKYSLRISKKGVEDHPREVFRRDNGEIYLKPLKSQI